MVMYGRVANRVAILVAAVSLVSLAGCGQQMGALLYHTGLIPEEKNKAQFPLTQNRLAILVDDPAGAMPNADLRNDLVAELTAMLVEHKACGAIVPESEMAGVERSNRDFDALSIRYIGEKVHADQVLHIQIQSFSPGDEAKVGVYKGKARALVKVCSTEPRPDVRLWPAGGDGMPVEVMQPSEQTDQWNGGGKASDLYSRMIAARLGKRIAMLFYQHPVEDENAMITGRNERPK